MSAVAKTTHHGACPHDCPDTCAMQFEVENGRLVGVRGNAEHPMTRGGLCVKLKDYEKRHYHPDRLHYPLRRTGPKGSGQYERIDWDTAIDTIATRWQAIIAADGAQAIVPYSYLGHQGLVHGLNGGDAFFNRLGASVMERTFCGEGSATAWLLTYGPSGGMDPESFKHSDFIVIWACNSVSTNLHHWHIVKDAQKAGARVVCIDAYASRTAKASDWHLAPRPGTDGALAMALINTIIEEDLVDRDYVDRYAVGFDELAERARPRTAEWAAEITGIPAADIRRLAREYAGAQRAAIRIGVALERHAGGGQTVRAVCCLPVITGAWREVGGGIMQMPVWEHPYRFDVLCRPDWIPAGTRALNNLQIGRALTGEIPLDPPIRSMMCWNSNPVTQAPEADKIVRGLEREDLFLVVADHFMSDTAAYADIVLPATMGAEMEDIILSWGHNYLTYNAACAEPPGETRSNREIFRNLATAMGFDEPELHWSDSECLEHFVDWDGPACEGIDLAYLREHGFAHLSIGGADDRAPHRAGNFPTPSGKAELKTSLAANGNFVAGPFRQMYEDMQGGEPVDELPDYVPPRESPASNPELAARYPLNIVSPKSHGFLNSCYANMDEKIRGQGEQFVLINPADAAARGIDEDNRLRVFNDRGAFEGVARLTTDVNPGVVVATLGYWRQLNRGTVNVVSSAEFVNMGHAPSFSDNLVEVALAD
ncbi:MAG: molybdopterin-containing oxidoreductase family protein [Gammaproteobacteria bacterium]